MDNTREYVFNGITYIQRPLVLGQVRQLVNLLEGTSFRRDGGVQAVIEALGGKIGHALAIVLTEKGESPRDKDLDNLAGELEYVMTPEALLQVIDDFFSLNPVSSLFERMAATMENVTGAFGTVTGSTSLSSPSPPETSPGET